MKVPSAVLVMLVSAMVAAAPLGTEFTYQGVLSDAGAPAAGVFDFQFYLYNAAGGGSQVGPLVVIEDVTVTAGRFTTQIDFGSVFDGTALWLEVGVRDGGSTGTFTVLSPRQELTAAPFAQHSQTADSATTAGHAATADSATTAGHATTAGSATSAGDADTVDGQHGTYYLTWSNFVGIPTDLADGDDDTLADLSCSSDEIARWNGSAWNCSSVDDTPYARTYVVGPVGTATENGTALLNAVAAITPPTSQEEAVLVMIEPGVYDLGTNYLSFTSWMTIEGGGVNATFISSAFCGEGGTIYADGTTSGIGLRRLSAENTCSSYGEFASALFSMGDGAVIERVRLSAIGSDTYNFGARVGGQDVRVYQADVKAEGGGGNYGVQSTAESAIFSHLTAEAIGGSEGTAAFSYFSGDDLLVENSTLRASGGTDGPYAFSNWNADGFTLRHVIAEAELGPVNSIGVRSVSESSFGVLDDVRATGETAIVLKNSGLENSYHLRNVNAEGYVEGIRCFAGAAVLTLDIDDSWILGASGVGVSNVSGPVGCDITIKGSYLMGSPGGVSGTATCIATWDDTSLYFNSCPGAGP